VTLLIVYVVLAIGVSFLCSMLEACLLSLSPSFVKVMAESGSRVGRKLQSMKSNIDRPLAAILTLNTIAHTAGAAGVGAQAAIIWGSAAVGIASAIMTLLILVLSEIIPKTIGAILAKRLAAFTAITTHLMILLCMPLILLLEWMHRLLRLRRQGDEISRAELIASLGLGHESGALEAYESRIMTNLIALQHLTVADILTPRTVVFTLQADRSARDVLDEHKMLNFARIPVVENDFDSVIGYLTRYDLHQACTTGRETVTMRELMKPLEALPEQAAVSDALQHMLRKRMHIALVVDEYGGAEGIVTLEDALESLLGVEIVDESDPVTDMQQLARRIKHRREEAYHRQVDTSRGIKRDSK
jgi:CBS domain containing-hemolysin-like protein